jgi:scyllo-inositol 2-dehydrogenase (NADP+)
MFPSIDAACQGEGMPDRGAGPIGVGLVGYGLAGSGLHAPLIGVEPRLRLHAVASRHPEKVHRDLPAVRVVATPAALLEDPAVELVVVAAPNPLHHQLAGAALRAGRHVVVDKPFVTSSSAADELIGLAERGGRQLSVFQNRRWDGDYLTVKHCVRAGLLGRVSTYIARYDRFAPHPAGGWREREELGSGVLWDLGAHLIDQALQLFGLPATVMADVGAQRPGAVADDYFHLVLGYRELRAILHAGSLVRGPGPRFEAHGDKGSFVKYGVDAQALALESGGRPGDPGWGIEPEDRYGTLTTEVAGLEVTGRLATLPGSYQSFYLGMAGAILGEGPVPVAAAEARDTTRMIECALQSSREGRVVAVR